MGSLWQLAGAPSSLSENRHNEFAFIIIVRRINLFELIEHKVNFSLGGAFRTHLRNFKFEAYQPRLTAFNINASGRDEVRRKGATAEEMH